MSRTTLKERPPAKHQPLQKWASAVKEKAVALFILLGNCNRVTEELNKTGIPITAQIIRKWKTEPWWFEMIEKIREEEDAGLDARFNKIIQKALDNLEDRLVSGDIVLTKTGETLHKAISAKESAQIISSIVDKRELLRGKPTSRSEKISTQDRLQSLATKFKEMKTGRVIDVTPTEVTEDAA